MRRLLPYILIGFLLFVLTCTGGCRRDQKLPVFRWPMAGGEFDTLTLRMERGFHDFTPADSLMSAIRMLDSISNAEKNKDRLNVMRSRTLFWKARHAQRFATKDSAISLVRQAMQLTDSATRKYDFMRMKSLWYSMSDDIDGAEKYRHYEEAMDYARTAGDGPYEFATAILMGNLMGHVDHHEKSIEYYKRADSIATRFGFMKLPVKNQVNIASSLSHLGRTREADSILLSLEGHPALEGDTFTQNLVYRNLYAHGNVPVSYLQKAHDQIKLNPRFRNLRGLYRALLAEYNLDEGNADSIQIYARLAMEDLPYISELNYQAIIWESRSLAWEEEGRLDSALYCRQQYERTFIKMMRQERVSEILRMSAVDEMKLREAHYRMATLRRNWIVAFCLIVMAAAGVIVALLLNRRGIRHRMEALSSELELEKTRRKMAATSITMEQTDAFLSDIRDELTDLRHEGEIRESSARRLEQTIRHHLGERRQDETFREMFDTLNPHFVERLRERCPDLADSYVRLACFLLMDLDTKRISSLMMIKPESVRQARWRLSRYLAIPEGETLESFLRSLNNM